MGLKEFYHSMEDHWYSFLDRIDKSVPIYRVIDPVDKVLPSFAVFLVLVLALIGVFGLPLVGVGGNTDVVLTFRDEQGNPIQGLVVTIEYGDVSHEKTTNSLGKILLNGIPLGTTLSLTAQHDDFDSFSGEKTIDSANPQFNFTLALKKAPASQLTFQFTDAGGLSLSGKPLTVELSCANGTPIPTSTYTVTNGVLSVTPPADCSNLVGTITGNGYVKKEGVLFSAQNSIIQLQAANIEKGKVKVTVLSMEENSILPNMEVELISTDGVSFHSLTTAGFGVAIFNDVPVGNYYASVTDPLGNYGLETSDTIIILANQTVNADVIVGKQIQGVVHVTVVDKANGTTIANATVKLVGKTDNKLYASKTTQTGQTTVDFEPTAQGPFILTASHQDYLAQTKDIGLVSGEQSVTLALDKLTAANSGKVTVNVKDEDGLPVDNAQVLVYDAGSGFIAHAYQPQITDSNGNAAFTGVQSGTYFARATKYPAGPSDSTPFTTDKSVPADASVILKIGMASVQVTVKDTDGNPIPFSNVEYLTDGTDECTIGKCVVQTDALGIVSKSFKADRKVFVKASAAGFSSFTSLSEQLYAGKTSTIFIELEKVILGSTPSIQFVAVKDPLTNAGASELKKGKTYWAIFHLQIPSALNLDKAGIHIRVGDEPLMENDAIRIISLSAPSTVALKGTTYQPDQGMEADEENLTNGEAKWVNLEWNAIDSGVYEIGVLFRVMEQSAPLDPLSIYYRAYGVDDSAWLRDPFDSILGTSDAVSGKSGQYAEAYQKIYYSGKPIVCDESFCYSGETIVNEDDELLVEGPPYNLSVNKLHTYSFVLTSASSTVYQEPKLRVFLSNDGFTPSDEALFESYNVTGTSGQNLSANGISTNDVPGGEGQGLDIGKLSQYQTISANYSFITKQPGPVNIVVQLINEGEIVFSQVVESEIKSGKQLSLNITPMTAAAFIPTEFTIHVTDEQGFDVQDTLVSLLKIDPNKNQQFVSKKYTDITGKVTVTAPASLPKTHFVFDAMKGGYESNVVEIVVDENIVKFTPAQLTFSLPNAPNTDQFLALDITNLSQGGLTLSNALITGDFQGLLSNGEMQNYLKQYAGVTSIKGAETKTIQLKAATSPSINVISTKNVSGSALFTFQSPTNQEWVQNVPLNIQIKVVGSCDEGAIQLSGTPASGTLQTTAFSSKSQTPFQIANVCQSAGSDFPMKNLKAKLIWKSNPIGNVELAVTDIEASQQSVEVLKNGTFVTLFQDFKSIDETTYESILTFTPFPGNIGETADFTITIAGELGTPTQPVTVQKTFDVKIKVTNLETCIVFDPEPAAGIEIEADDDEAEFKINTDNCGEVPVDISLCAGANNSNCSGGAPEGRLYLSEYVISNLKGTKVITVERGDGTLPGTYDITVDARVPGTSFQRVASVEVEVESDSTYAFSMDKSTYTLYQKGATDSSTIINRLLKEDVKVKASVCDWEKASKNSTSDNFHEAVAYGGVAGAAAGVYAGTSAVFTAWSSAAFWGAFWPVGIAVFVAVFVLQELDDPCDDDFTGVMPDYIINLKGGKNTTKFPPDAIDVLLSSNVASHITGKWNTETVNMFTQDEKAVQSAGVVFTNETGYTNPNPIFGVVTLRANEHINGDPVHAGDAKVSCSNGNFYPYNVGEKGSEGGCTSTTELLAEKFHVKFKTQEIDQSLPDLTFDTISCFGGGALGASGSGALPNVAFNWAWADGSGIPMDVCDVDNPNAIFCDATQFNIAIMKRLHALDGFLAANNNSFTCPENPTAQPLITDVPNPTDVVPNTLGITSVGYTISDEATIQFRAKVKNLTISPQTAELKVEPGTSATQNIPVIPSSCTASASVSASGETELSCTISGFGISSSYYVSYNLSSTTTPSISYSNPIVYISTESVQQQKSGTCEDIPKSTAITGSVPAINKWIDKADPVYGKYVNQSSVVFTSEVPNLLALTELMHFDAYLMRDGYSHDFENDFRTYYTTDSFADAPSWFKGGNGAVGFNQFYGENDKLVFTNKYFDDSTLPAAGRYRVDLDVFFQDDWAFFDENGETSAKIGVVFYHVENPSPNSPFYRLPFNGLVGQEGALLNRVGYGVEYINGQENPVKINDSLVQSYSSTESSALSQVNVNQKTDLRSLNSLPSTRGNLLEVTASSDNLTNQVVFTPSLATPVMMQVTHNVTSEPFAAYYQVNQNNVPVDTGNTLTFWEGAGNCYDYTGVPIYEKFNFSPDRAATPADKYTNWPFLYAVDWEKALVNGDAYLRTIFYTPPEGVYALNAEASSARFFTSNYQTPSTTQLLDGISTLPYNNASQTIDSLQDVFDLVGDGKICVNNTGIKTRFFWNPETIYKQTSQTSISAETNQLVAGQTCLGPPI